MVELAGVPMDVWESKSARRLAEMFRKVGMVGVGTMGEPMAANLLKAGYIVYVADLNPAPVERLVQTGAIRATSAAEMAMQVQVLLTSLPSDAAVEEVMLGTQGVIAGGQPGLIVVDTSTISPLTAQRLSAALEVKGIAMLEAPVSGGQAGAIAGTLAIMVGGAHQTYEQVLSVLQALGQNITYVGDHGAALTVKLCNNLIIGAVVAAVSESLAMAAKAGIDPGVVHQILCASTARGWIIQEYLPKSLLVGNLKPGFKLSLEHKDLGLALDYGKQLGVPMFVTALVHQLYTQALGLGKGDLDFSALGELYSEATGVSLKRRDA
jgi:3-hydroxyisobutyrate dehydrogenase